MSNNKEKRGNRRSLMKFAVIVTSFLFIANVSLPTAFNAIQFIHQTRIGRSGGMHQGQILESSPHATSSPVLLVISPSNGTVFTGGAPIAISFATINFNLTAPEGQPNQAGFGHMHVYVDGSYYELIDQVVTIYLWLSYGWHNISLQLVNNDHTPLTPNVEVNMTLARTQSPSTAAPKVAILTPSEGAKLMGPDVSISFIVFNFYLTQPVGQANIPNEGHVHVLVNGKYFELVSSVNPIVLTGLGPGSYSVKLMLVNNDHSPYTVNGSEITTTVNFTVTSLSSGAGQAVTPGELSMTQSYALGALVLALIAAIAAITAAVITGRKRK